MRGVTNHSTERTRWALAPSDFAFLWEGCKRCFYLKVAHREQRPRTPMPGIFIRIDALGKDHIDGMRTSEIAPTLPAGTIKAGEGLSVKSADICVPGHAAPCIVRGRLDGYIEFDDG